MKKLLLIFFGFSLLFGVNVDTLLKEVNKSSPEYELDLILAKKIKSMKYEGVDFTFKANTQKEYMDNFFKLIKLEQLYLTLPNKNRALKEKLSIISKNLFSPNNELQKLYYQKQLEINQKLLAYLSKNLPKFEKEAFEGLNSVYFNIVEAKSDIEKSKEQLLEIKHKIEKLNIDLQKWELLNKPDKKAYVKSLIQKEEEKIKGINQRLLRDYLVVWLNDIKLKDKKAFSDDDNVLKYANSFEYKEGIERIVKNFEKLAFGSSVLVYDAQKKAKSTLQKVFDILNYPLFKVGDRTITPVNFFIFILVLVLGWYIGKYYKKFIYSIRQRYNISYSTATLLANMGYYVIITLAFLIALKVIGLDLSSLAIIAGALSVGIGFGLQNVVSNFVSGIILMFERSIKVGDYIQIDENTKGEVMDISMRSTIIRTNDNIDLIIPNQTFIQNNVINWTLQDEIVRFRVPFGVEYGSDIDEVERVILEALKNSNLPYVKEHPKYDITPRVVFMEMADSSLNFELFVWVRGEYARRPRRTRGVFLKLIYNALNRAGIGIPFPQQDLHIKESVPFEIIVKKDKTSSKQ